MRFAANARTMAGMTIAPSTPATVAAAFLDTVARTPDQVALIGPDATYTWAELHDRVARAVGALDTRPGDTVAYLLPNSPEQWITDLALTFAGATVCPLYATLSPSDIEFVMQDAGATRLLTEPLPCDGEPAPLSPPDPDAVAVLIYTSGTTARPKGVELTHASLLASVRGWREAIDLEGVQRIISWLPNAHVMDRVLHYSLALTVGFETTTCADPREIAVYLRKVEPHLFIAVPRVWEKLKAAAETHHLDRHQLGLGQTRFAGSGAAPIAPDVVEFFHALDVPLLEGYALSESGCLGAVGVPGTPVGSVGRPHAAIELRLAGDGEILLKGPTLMRGYRARSESPIQDGWLHTGDIGTLDADGNLRIVDRKKELIITAGGKNISPARVEAELKAASPHIAHAVAVGDRRPYLTALLVPEPGADRMEIAEAVIRANARLARVEQIKRYTVLEADWRPGGLELTPTQKLRRRSVLTRYADRIEAMYAAP
jgi:long-subunit acyl-CoA synthetase (AMP-forming)